jgi:malonate transporter and related proteins
MLGFGIVAVVIAAGYLVGRLGILGEGALDVLSRAAFFVFSPALLFIVLGQADITQLFSDLLPVSALAAVVALGTYVFLARAVLSRDLGSLTVGGLGASYVNSNNIGLPVAAYVLGDPALAAPVLLFQFIVLAPIALTVLDIAKTKTVSVVRILSQPVRNPLIIASALGVVVSATDATLPVLVTEPIELIGQAAIPTLLFALGLSLAGQKLWQVRSERCESALATTIKLVWMPFVAWLAGRFLFELDAQALFTVVILASLPSAQNVFNYAQRYQVAVGLGRDTVVITTVLSLPVMLLVAYLLAPG